MAASDVLDAQDAYAEDLQEDRQHMVVHPQDDLVRAVHLVGRQGSQVRSFEVGSKIMADQNGDDDGHPQQSQPHPAIRGRSKGDISGGSHEPERSQGMRDVG